MTDFYTKATLYKGDLNKVEDSILLEFIEKFKKIRNLIIEEKEIFFHPQQNNKNYFNALENILDNLDDVQKVKELISHDRSLNLYNAFTLLFKQRDTKGKLKEKKSTTNKSF